MHTNFASSSYTSYSQTQSFDSDAHYDAFRASAAVEKQTTETRYSQQYSRSPYGASMSTSMTSIQQFTEKSGANPSFGFAGKQCRQESRYAVQRRDHGPDRFGNSKNNRCNNEFRNYDNSYRCGGHQSNYSSAHVKPNENQFNRPNMGCCHSQANNHSQSAGHESNWSTTQTKTVQKHFVSQTTDRGHSQAHGSESQSSGQRNEWSKTQVQNNQASIDLGDYDLALNKSDSSISLTNEKTGNTTKIWGDPHITTNGTTGMFNGSLTFNLPDKTKVTVGTQAQGAVSYADQVTITQGNKAYVVNGLSQLDSNPLTVERSHNGPQLDQQTADGFTLVANKTGTGWINPLTGSAPTSADFSKA
jgi:hypothetical protein